MKSLNTTLAFSVSIYIVHVPVLNIERTKFAKGRGGAKNPFSSYLNLSRHIVLQI